MKFTKPMLAASLLPSSVEHTDTKILEAMSKLRYPVLATVKKDGIRALRLNGSLLSRTLKPIPNKSIRDRSLILPGGFDMELWNPELNYEEIESIVMSKSHPDSQKIQFHILDWFRPESYVERLHIINAWFNALDIEDEINLPSEIKCWNAQELMELFKEIELDDEEGICFRTPNSPYKCGRSTLKEQYLIKLCRFHTSECVILSMIEQYENINETKRHATGQMNRSSHGFNMIGKDTLGALEVKDIHSNIEFKIGTGVGLDDKKRKEMWMNKEKYVGTIWKYKYKGGGKNKPRSPILLGKRDVIDII